MQFPSKIISSYIWVYSSSYFTWVCLWYSWTGTWSVYGHMITKFSWMGRFTIAMVLHCRMRGAPLLGILCWARKVLPKCTSLMLFNAIPLLFICQGQTHLKPLSMDHPCGPSPQTSLWTWSLDYPCGPPLIFDNEFFQRCKQILGTLSGRNCVNLCCQD